MFNITFRFETGDPVVISANAGEKLLDVARKANVAIDAPCSGNGVCGKCRVRLVSGYLDAPINRHITSEEYAAGWRLACLATVSGDAEIEVPDIASAYRSRMKMADLSSPEEIAIFENLRRQLEEAGVAFGSDLSFLPLELEEPTLDDTMPDNERLLRAVEAAAGVDESAVMLPYAVLVLSDRQVEGRHLLAVESGHVLHNLAEGGVVHIHVGDIDKTGQLILFTHLPGLLGPDLNAGFSVYDNDGRAGCADGFLRLSYKIKITGRIYYVYLVSFPLDRYNGGIDGKLPLLFFFAVIAQRISVGHLAHTGRDTGQIGKALGKACLSASAMSQQHYVTNLVSCVNLHIVFLQIYCILGIYTE